MVRKISVRFDGEKACFTRPETKVERMSYPLPTPSAARGMLEAIYWKPQIVYHVTSIKVLKPIRYFSIVTNEIQSKQSAKTGVKASLSIAMPPYGVRTQRRTVGLSDVSYIIDAIVSPATMATEPLSKHINIFNDRLARGACFRRPALGLREYAAEFYPVSGDESPIAETIPVGLMFYDFDYTDGHRRAKFFEASINDGVMAVPVMGGAYAD